MNKPASLLLVLILSASAVMPVYANHNYATQYFNGEFDEEIEVEDVPTAEVEPATATAAVLETATSAVLETATSAIVIPEPTYLLEEVITDIKPLENLEEIVTQKEEYKQSLNNVLNKAIYTHRAGFNVQRDLRVSARAYEHIKRQFQALQKRKRREVLLLHRLDEEITTIEEKNNLKLHSVADARGEFESQKKLLSEFIQFVYQQEEALLHTGPSTIADGVKFALQGTLGKVVETSIQNRAMHRVREGLLYHLESVQGEPVLYELRQATIERLNNEIKALTPEYVKTRDDFLTLKSRVTEMSNITNQIHNEVIALQAEMSQFEMQIRRGDREVNFDDSVLGEASDQLQTFSDVISVAWPVYGVVSAEFDSESYRRFFGMKHNAIDIAIPQRSNVYAAADGVVYVVRDGGEFGYSYVLVGHRDGYATLYGHINEFLVNPGDVVKQGDAIALSGGTPGTWGAGQMTTGAHLHFEVFKKGQHINPRQVLPGVYVESGQSEV